MPGSGGAPGRELVCDREGESTPPGQYGHPHGADASEPFGRGYSSGVWSVGIQSSTVTVNQI